MAAEPTKVYPNSPLTEVIFEVRFPGEPVVECHRDKLFAHIRKEFSRVLVPKVVIGESPFSQPYHFQTPDQKRTLLVALNRLGFSTKAYPGFDDFKKEVLDHVRIFGELFPIKDLNRTGLRYVNLIPYTREAGLVPLHRYFRLEIKFPGAPPSRTTNISLGYVVPMDEDGSLTVRIDCAKSQDGGEALVLDFDYAKQQNLTFDQIPQYLEESHTKTKEFFETLITDEYRKFMRGEVIE